MSNFELQKKKQLSRRDLSNEGHIDKQIVSLVNKINKNPNYYTTSSCAGRIMLIIEKQKKEPNLFIYKTHNKVSLDEIKKNLKKITSKELIYLKQDSCILHVACKTIKDAQDLVTKAKLAGWKRSGIMTFDKRIICELISTEHLALPIFKNKILVSDDYLKIVIKEANKKLKRVRKKIKKLENLI